MAEEFDFSKMKNAKADVFEKYMKDEGLDFFQRRDVKDAYDTTVFVTMIPAGKHRVPVALITNNSMYVLLRAHMGTAPVGPAAKTFLHFLSRQNAESSLFKYLIAEDNNVFLDVCFPCVGNSFDPAVVRTTLNLIVYHMQDHYEDIARRLAKTSEETDGFSL